MNLKLLKIPAGILCLLLIQTISLTNCTSPDTVAVTFADGTKVMCEIADSPKKLRQGLSGHASLAPGQGMIFVYPAERPNVNFWMPNRMKFSIDMIFLDGNKQILLIETDVPICDSNIAENCPSYGPGNVGCQYVVEVVAGLSDKMGFAVGDTVNFNLP